MTCAELERWLDDGRPDAGGEGARLHVRDCARCAAALAAARELESTLELFVVAAPGGFTERVMAKLAIPHAARSPSRVTVWAPAPAMEWWVRAAADPAAALALVLAAILAWRGEALPSTALGLARGMLAGASAWFVRVAGGSGSSLRDLAAPFADRHVPLAFGLAMIPALLWVSWRLFAWVEVGCAPSSRIVAGAPARRA